MSVHLCVVRGFADHPDWDWSTNGGAKEFAREILGKLPKEEKNRCEPPDYEWLVRPTDFGEWRRVIIESDICNREYFLGLVELLEREPEYWLYVSQ